MIIKQTAIKAGLFLSKLISLIILPMVVFVFISSRSPILGNVQLMVVLTNSMEPKIPAGSILFVKKDYFYQTGQAIAFTNQKKIPVVHRIINKVQTPEAILYQVKGDRNDTADDELVSKSQIQGREIFTIPYLGKLSLFLKTPQGFIILIVIPAFLFICFELFNIKKEVEKEINKEVRRRSKLIT